VHYDAKSGAPPQVAADNLRFISPRRAVFWGGFSMLEATLDLLKTAMDAGGYDRYVLLSGDSLPLRPAAALAEALLWPNVEYIELITIPDEPATKGKTWDEIRAMLGSEHPGRFYNFQCWDSLLTNPFTEDQLCDLHNLDPADARALRAETSQLMARLLTHLPPRPRLFETFYYGTQWWALTTDLINRIAPQLFAEETADYFRFMEVPDEHFFNCVTGNFLSGPAAAGRAVQNNLMITDHAARAENRLSVTTAMIRTAAGTTNALFIRKFHPAAAPDIATAIRTGRYRQEILGIR
jgi:hypothetical protein